MRRARCTFRYEAVREFAKLSNALFSSTLNMMGTAFLLMPHHIISKDRLSIYLPDMTLVKEGRPCFLFQLDTIVIYGNNLKRYILTAVDHATKLGYARMYKNKSSRSAADFLYRLRYLVNQPIENLQTDNGS